MHDLIESTDTGTVEAGLPVYQYENVGDGYVRGIELDQRFGLGTVASALSPITLWANEAFIDSQVDTADGERPFQLQPDYIFNLGTDIDIGPWGTSLTVAAKYVGARAEYDVGERTDYSVEWTLDAGIRQQITRNFSVRIDAVNLTSTDSRGTTIDTTTGAVSEVEVEQDYRYFMFTGEARF